MRMVTILIAFLFSFLLLHQSPSFAQSAPTETSFCAYQAKRESLSSNPRSNKRYTPDEWNQEPFAGASITKVEIRQCLQARKPIKNHHIVFEDYLDVWQSLAKATGDYTIPLLIEGGVFHADIPFDPETNRGGIRLLEFRDPNIQDTSALTEAEQKAFGFGKQGRRLVLIRPQVRWERVFIDSVIVTFQGAIAEGVRTRDSRVPLIVFIDTANFNGAFFAGEADFMMASFEKEAYFSGAIFKGRANFNNASFEGDVEFTMASFAGIAEFGVASFKGKANFGRASFEQVAYFAGSTFEKTAHFNGNSFIGDANFLSASFGELASFKSKFNGNANFGEVKVSGQLIFDNSNWEKRLDLRGTSTKELRWDSTQNPSTVQGVVDVREARIGLATFKGIQFQDLVDFSRTTFGQYKVKDTVEKHTSPQVLFENNTAEKDTDFLHVTFDSPVFFIDNRFRSTLDLTGVAFAKREHPAPLCLSYNRINRLVFASQHLGNVRRADAPQCQGNTIVITSAATTTSAVEPLPSIYKTLEKAFKDANDQRGVNEAWYLATVAQRDQRANEQTVWSVISWMFGDLPSRYTVDVWRTVRVSILIMVMFYVLYFLVFWCLGRSSNPDHWMLHISQHPERQRGFRLRLFEPISGKDAAHKRMIIPWRDAAMLSMRAYLKLGLGTRYPNTQPLKTIIYVEWVCGIVMLIHFILAVKNNLPFILPFLGVVH